jgi:hypothetical protein
MRIVTIWPGLEGFYKPGHSAELHLRHPSDVAEDGSLDGGYSGHQLNLANNQLFPRWVFVIWNG